ncbi:hypothetical protein Taro_049068 [Colocasia esculenta]|uniref:J domain-containing protein n=1 Tax=Colocasia esculenta TaxID=4460 RepID=A0A843X9V8_COLES|nr:hypothetical protein [Colocasia esculenta]
MLRAVWRTALRKPLFSPPPHPAFFHSTPVACAKWKSKFNHQLTSLFHFENETDMRQVLLQDEGRDRQPSKTYVRYAVRQKRADAKRALRDLLNGTCSNPHFQDEDISWHAEGKGGLNEEDDSDDFDGQPETKNYGKSKPHHPSGKHKHNRSKRKKKNRGFYSNDDDMHSDTVFQATFGNRCYTWSFRPWNDVHLKNSAAGFEWRDGSNQSKNGRVWGSSESDDDSRWANNTRTWERESDFDDDSDDHGNDNNVKTIGSYSHRVTLGLPPAGPLKIDDVKTAFRTSALKWHPDKHQGPSQAVAEEKFKRCLDAYKYLCNSLNTA